MLIKINLLPKKKTVFKTINAFSLVLLILNMSLGGVLVTLNPVNACNINIKIIKDDISNSGEEFQFTATTTATTTTNLTPSSFNLSDNGTNSTSSTTFSNLSIGTYTITETAKTDWNLDSISCRSEGANGASTTATIVNANGLAGKVEIELHGNDINTICTFTNSPISHPEGSIEVCKYIDDDGLVSTTNDRYLSTTTPWTFDLYNGITTTTATTTESGCTTFSNLNSGNYDISEIQKQYWQALSPSTGATSTILEAGEHKTINFINYKEPLLTIKGAIEICKYYDNGNIGTYEIATDTPMEWLMLITYPDLTALEVETSSSTGCIIVDNLELGNYTINEMPITGGGWINSYPQNNQHNIILDDETTKKIYFLNYQYEEELGSIEVCKYIDDDGLASTTNDRYLSTTTPWEFILDNGRGTTTATTTESGCTIFSNLNLGNYDISEIQKQYWQALNPLNGATSTNLQAGEDKTINFVNYYTKPYCGDGNINEELVEVCDLGAGYNGIPCTPAYGGTCSYCSNICKLTELTGPYCGDGVINGNEECDGGNNCNSLCKKTGGGGGGGGSTIALKISDEKIYCFGEESVRITWRTNYYKESVIFYGEQSQKNAGTPPNYGYASSTKKTTEKATFHSVVVNDIKDNTYYFRPMSGNVKGKELSIDMTECRPEVKGEEGFPVLTIDKTIDTEFINPGDKNIEYTILVSNTGNLDAFDVVLTDSLPDGLTFASSTDIVKTWNLGDMKPGENKTIAYFVDSNKEIKEGAYINIAEVKASNHNKISDSVSLEVREVKVLAVTGFNVNEFIAISLSAFLLFGASFSLKKIQL